MNRIESILESLKSRETSSSDYPQAVYITPTNIPVFDAETVSHPDLLVNLSLQELDINDQTRDPTDLDVEILSQICDMEGLRHEGGNLTKEFLLKYRKFIDEVVHSLSLEGPGVCIIENVFSEDFMDKVQAWVDGYLQKDTSSKKDHFAFGTNKRIWRVPEKLPSDLLYTYLRYDALQPEDNSPVLNHVLDRFLGLHHIGSLAINQIQPGGAAQLTHTDYPPGFYPVEDLRRVFTSYALHRIMPYFSLQAGIALCDMDSKNGSTAVIPFSHTIEDSDWLIAGGKPKPGETESPAQDENKMFYEAVQPYLVQEKVKKGSCILFNRKLLHQGGANYSDRPRTALLLQAIMPFGVKMERMECEGTVDRLMEYILENKASKEYTEKKVGRFTEEEVHLVKEKYFGDSKSLREILRYRLHGPRFPRDMDAAEVGEKNN